MPKKYIVETDKGKFVVEVADSTSDAKAIDPNETDNPLLAGIKGFGQGVVDQFKGYGKFNKDNKDPFSFKGSSPGVEKFMQTPLAKPTGVETIDNLLSPLALSTLGMTAARPVLEAPINRGSVIKGLRSVAEPTQVWRKGVNALADKLERGVTEPKRSMSDVYSEKPAPPRDPNAPAPRVEPTKISDVVQPSKGATPYEMPKPAEGRISDVVKEVPGAQPYDMPQEPEGKISDVVHDTAGAEPYDMGPPDKTMADVYSESPAPPTPEPAAPTGPDRMSPRVVGKAPTLEGVLTDILQGEMGSNDLAASSTSPDTFDLGGTQKPKVPALTGKVKAAGGPGGYTTDNPPKPAYEVPGRDLPQEGVTRSPADGRSGKVDRAMESNQGADDLGEMLDRIYGTTEADPVPAINPEGQGPKTSFVDTMKSTEPEFTRDVHTGAESGTPEAKSAQAHHKMFGEMDADYRRSLDDPLRSILVALLGGGGAASFSKEPE